MSEKDGGPAFPTTKPLDFWGDPHGGMSLRDYFAAAALQGMHARDTYDSGLAEPTQRAHLAYIDADAMLKERAK